jgi:hypothetical protein
MRARDNHSSTDSTSHALGKVLPRAVEANETESLTERFLAAKGLVWSQEWDCGDWRPADEPVSARGYIESFTPEGKRLGMSVCESCASVRIVDCDRLLQRLLPRDATADTCAHKWKLAVTRASLDPLASGDLLFAVYEEELFALRLGPITPRVAYDVAAVPPASLPDVNVATLPWQRKYLTELTQAFMIGKRSIQAESIREDGRMTIGYDHYYGCLGGPHGLVDESPVFVAIVHEADMEGRATVDLRRFHFRTWEDGLSNLAHH